MDKVSGDPEVAFFFFLLGGTSLQVCRPPGIIIAVVNSVKTMGQWRGCFLQDCIEPIETQRASLLCEAE